MAMINYADKVALNSNSGIPDINKVNATDMNEIKSVVNENDTRLTTAEGEIDTAQLEIDNLQTGWNLAGETWTYSSVDDPTGVIKVNADVTTKYSLGMRIKMTNGGNTIFGILTKIGAYGADEVGYTYLTFLHEINPSTSTALHLMTNSAITENYYSNMKAPFGFPLSMDFSTIFNKQFVLPAVAGTKPAQTWSTMYSDITAKIEAGTYMLIFKFGLGNVSNNGNAVVKFMIGGEEIQPTSRACVPQGINTTYGLGFALQTFETTGNYTFNMQIWPVYATGLNGDGSFFLIKVS